MLDLDSTFTKKVAILISTDDQPEFQAKRIQTKQKLQQLTVWSEIYDKNLSESNSIFQLIET